MELAAMPDELGEERLESIAPVAPVELVELLVAPMVLVELEDVSLVRSGVLVLG